MPRIGVPNGRQAGNIVRPRAHVGWIEQVPPRPACGRDFEGGPRAKYDRQACAVTAYQQRHPDRVTEQRKNRERRKRREKGQGPEAAG